MTSNIPKHQLLLKEGKYHKKVRAKKTSKWGVLGPKTTTQPLRTMKLQDVKLLPL